MGGLCSKVAEELDGDNREFEMNANYYQVTTKGFEAVSYEIPEDADLDLIVQDYRDELASRGASQSMAETVEQRIERGRAKAQAVSDWIAAHPNATEAEKVAMAHRMGIHTRQSFNAMVARKTAEWIANR